MKRRLRLARLVAACTLAALAGFAHAGAQQYEPMSASVRASLHSAVSDQKPPTLSIKDPRERERWLGEMSRRLTRYIADEAYRHELLISIHYEATRAGLDPQLVLALIQVESAFRKYAISSAGARGYMQVMPFWIRVIGEPGDNLFFMRKNLRYGCTILRHYLDIEKGDLFRALGRYNGSLGRAEYPNLVRRAWENNWSYVPLPPAPPQPAPAQTTAQPAATQNAATNAPAQTPPAQPAQTQKTAANAPATPAPKAPAPAQPPSVAPKAPAAAAKPAPAKPAATNAQTKPVAAQATASTAAPKAVPAVAKPPAPKPAASAPQVPAANVPLSRSASGQINKAPSSKP